MDEGSPLPSQSQLTELLALATVQSVRQGRLLERGLLLPRGSHVRVRSSCFSEPRMSSYISLGTVLGTLCEER